MPDLSFNQQVTGVPKMNDSVIRIDLYRAGSVLACPYILVWKEKLTANFF